jgi:hypothetical protein
VVSSYEFLLEALQLTAASDSLKAAMGLTNTWMSDATLPVVDEQLIIRAFHWYDNMLQTDPQAWYRDFFLDRDHAECE